MKQLAWVTIPIMEAKEWTRAKYIERWGYAFDHMPSIVESKIDRVSSIKEIGKFHDYIMSLGDNHRIMEAPSLEVTKLNSGLYCHAWENLFRHLNVIVGYIGISQEHLKSALNDCFQTMAAQPSARSLI